MALAEGRKESRVQPKQKGEEGGGGGSGGGGGGGHFRRAGNACHWRGTAVTCSGERSSEEAATAAGGFLRAVTEIHVDNGKWTALSASLFSSLPALFSLHVRAVLRWNGSDFDSFYLFLVLHYCSLRGPYHPQVAV